MGVEMRVWELLDQYVVADGSRPPLSISRTSGRACLLSQLPAAADAPNVSNYAIYGVLGALRLVSGSHFLVITGRDYVGSYRNAPVFKVTSMRSLYCKHDLQISSSDKKREETYLERLLPIVLRTPGLLFSFAADLTNNAQRSRRLGEAHEARPLWKRADARFVWNHNLIQPLLEAEADVYALPVIQGSFQSIQVPLGDKHLQLALIARRCTRRTGTRMWRRGADLDGSVANFVETEQIVEADGFFASYVQVRGSIPVFWEQVVDLTYKPKIQAVHGEETAKAIERHFQDLVERYSSVLAVDLINQKGSEGVLSVAYSNAMRGLGSESVRYVPFDFHQICGHIHFERLSSLHDQIAEELLQQRFFLVAADGQVVEEQQGVVRANCIDCLDRTNVTQSLIARRSLEAQLRRIGLFASSEMIAEHPTFEAKFNLLWANHGDDVSIQYSGTPALKGDFVRYGRRTFAGILRDGLSSLGRYYLNNFADGLRQDASDLVAGHYDPRGQQWSHQSGVAELAAEYFPFIAAVIFACVAAAVLSVWRVGRGEDHVLHTLVWATLAACLGTAIRINGRQLCSRPRLKRS